MTKIRFIKDAVYETEGPNQGPRFSAGEEHDLREDLAQRWINRGAAVAVEAAPAQNAPRDAAGEDGADRAPPEQPAAPRVQAPRQPRR